MKSTQTVYGRNVLVAKQFEPNGTFTAITEARELLKASGYTIGSMQRDNPIGFADATKYAGVSKWDNMDKNDKALLDGVIIPYKGDFREGGAEIIFFTEPK